MHLIFTRVSQLETETSATLIIPFIIGLPATLLSIFNSFVKSRYLTGALFSANRCTQSHANGKVAMLADAVCHLDVGQKGAFETAKI